MIDAPGSSMAKRRCIFLLAAAATWAEAAPVAAHVGDRLFPIPCLSEEILARLDLDDGSVEDWLDAVGEPTLTPLDFNLWSDTETTSYDRLDPANLDFRIWMGWSRDGRIHVAGEFADDVYVNEYDPLEFPNFIFEAHDSMSFLIDGDHTGGEYLFLASHDEPEEALKTNSQAQRYSAISRVPAGPMVSLPHTTDSAIGLEGITNEPVDWMIHPPFARGGGSVLGGNPTVWLIEFFVTSFDRLHHLGPPEESVVSRFAGGSVIGFDVNVHDHDVEPHGPRAFYLLGEPNWEGIGRQAGNWVDGLLLGPGGESVDSAVQSVSWGRIKASLEPGPRGEDSLSDKD